MLKSLTPGLLIAFLVSCIFNPTDYLIPLKTISFVFIFLVFASTSLLSRSSHQYPIRLFYIAFLFILAPILSILVYYLRSGLLPYEGFALAKSFIPVIILFPLIQSRAHLNPLEAANNILFILGLTVITISFLVWLVPPVWPLLYRWNLDSGLLYLDQRTYSANFTASQIYHVSSPLLAYSLTYSLYSSFITDGAPKKGYQLMSVTSFMALLLAGSRNNYFLALSIPTLVLLLYFSRTLLAKIFLGIVAVFISMASPFIISSLLSPSENSNSIKLSLLDDYYHVFLDPLTLFVGAGIGSYHYWDAKSLSYFTTELTYLELFRYFGIPLSMLLIVCLLLPLQPFIRRPFQLTLHNCLSISYLLFLLTCSTNPNLFNSVGITFYTLILFSYFTHNSRGPLAV